MSNQIKSLSPCTDWFYTAPGSHEPIVMRIAAWALQENDEVVGLVAVSNATGVPKLAFPPAIDGGKYRHVSELSQTQRDRAKLG